MELERKLLIENNLIPFLLNMDNISDELKADIKACNPSRIVWEFTDDEIKQIIPYYLYDFKPSYLRICYVKTQARKRLIHFLYAFPCCRSSNRQIILQNILYLTQLEEFKKLNEELR